MTATDILPAPARRIAWLTATLADSRRESAAARTLTFAVPGWTGHRPGQHLDVRLTSADGYSAERSYSIAAPSAGDLLELTIQRVPDGEVSSYLVDEMRVGDQIEVRGPVGGWFVWDPATPAPAVLVAGGSGLVPLMCMIRARASLKATTPVFHLVNSVRTPDDAIHLAELQTLSIRDPGLRVNTIYTRSAPPSHPRGVGRLVVHDLPDRDWMLAAEPQIFICGPTGFVEYAANLLVLSGVPARTIRTERFGPTGA